MTVNCLRLHPLNLIEFALTKGKRSQKGIPKDNRLWDFFYLAKENKMNLMLSASAKDAALYILTFALIAAVLVLVLIFGKNPKGNNTKAIVYAAIMIALSFGLSYLKLFPLPLGGSVTAASLLPIMMYCWIFGMKRGVIATVIYGILQFIQEPYFYHPMQFLLDYPIAFGAICLVALFKEIGFLKKYKPVQFALGAVVAVFFRYAAHIVSGIFVFGSGDPENYSAVAWSFLYNSFCLADMAIALAVGVSLFAIKPFVKLIDSVNPAVVPKKVQAVETPSESTEKTE